MEWETLFVGLYYFFCAATVAMMIGARLWIYYTEKKMQHWLILKDGTLIRLRLLRSEWWANKKVFVPVDPNVNLDV